MIAWLRRRVFPRFGLKVAALCIALLLWSAVGHGPSAEVALTVPIEFTNVPAGLEVSTERIPETEVRLSGPVRIVRNLDRSQVYIVIDLLGKEAGAHTIDLTGHEVHVPRDVRLVQVIPSQLRLQVDRSINKVVEVKPRVIGKFADGYGVVDIKASPASIALAGPQRRIDAITDVTTDPVDASGVVGTASFTAQVYVGDPLVRRVNPVPVQVIVTTAKLPSGDK